MSEPKKVRKPIHVVKKDGGEASAIYNALLHKEGLQVAEQKALDLSLHLPHDVDTFVTAEQDDDEIRFYVGVTIPF